MDTDSLPSTLVFVAFLLLFACLSLAHHAGKPSPAAFSFGKSTRWPDALTSWLKYACIIACAISGLAIIHSTGTFAWWPAAFLAFALLLFLAAVDQAISLIVRRTGWVGSFWGRTLNRLVPWASRGGSGPASNGAAAGDGEADASGDPAITEADLVSLDQRDREMLRSILRLDVTTAREIMVPRLDMSAVAADASLVQVSKLMIKSGHSRLPVYEETTDNILGIIHSRDVMEAIADGDITADIRDLLREAFVIPETKRIDDLLEELQVRGVQMALVVDEYGGTEGLVTMEDVLEEIVGEIEDEFSRTKEAEIVRFPDGAVLVDAGVPTDAVDEIFGTSIDSADVDTVGGYVYDSLGKIPQVGDVVTTEDLHIRVVSILGRRLRKLRIQRAEDISAD